MPDLYNNLLLPSAYAELLALFLWCRMYHHNLFFGPHIDGADETTFGKFDIEKSILAIMT